MASLQVFGLPASTDVARVLACLFEKDVEFQLIRTDTYKGDHKVPEFLKLQDPTGQVTFKHGEHTIIDSREVCRYIVEKFPNEGNKRLLGTGALERAFVEEWLQAEALNFDAPSSELVFHLAFAIPMGEKPNEDRIEQCEEKLAKVLDVYEQRLEDSKYLTGDDFTLADLSHLPNTHYLVTKSERGRELFYSRKNVRKWWDAISKRPSWKKVVGIQSEHPGPLQKFSNVELWT